MSAGDHTTGWTMPVSYCIKCDAGRPWREIPDEPCGCDFDNARIHNVPVVPNDSPDVAA